MLKISCLFLVAGLAVVLAGESDSLQRGVIHQIQKGVAGPNPYIFLTVPKGRSQSVVQGFEVVKEKNDKTPLNQDIDEDEDDDIVDDDDDYENDNENENKTQIDDDDDDNDNEEQQLADNEPDEANFNGLDKTKEPEADDVDSSMSGSLKLRKPAYQIKNAKTTHLMVSRQHAGAIMVPDQIIEIEAQSVIDEKTGQSALFLPRSVLDSIPDGSVVALMERPQNNNEDAKGRANRVIIRRRRKGSRRNLNRGIGGNRRYRVVKQGANNKQRNNFNPQNVVIVRRRNGKYRYGNKNKRRPNRRRIYLQA